MLVNRELFVLIIFLCFTGTMSLFGLNYLNKENRTNVDQSLRAIVHTVEKALNFMSLSLVEDIRMMSSNSDIVKATVDLINLPNPNALEDTTNIQEKLSAVIYPDLTQHNHLGYEIMTLDGLILSSSIASRVNKRTEMTPTNFDIWQRVISSEGMLIPYQSEPSKDYSEIYSNSAILILAAPVKKEDGTVIAIFLYIVDAGRMLSEVASISRFGQSGETYFFDTQGYLVSKSRFEDQLRDKGILEVGQSSILNITLTDPGYDITINSPPSTPVLETEKTQAFSAVVNMASGSNRKGYRDYRGVTVLGAWTWVESLNIALATEVDQRQALSQYNTSLIVLGGSFVVTALLAILFTSLLSTQRRRAINELELQQAVLEDRVSERTSDLFKVNDNLQKQVEERIRAEEQLKLAHKELFELNAELENMATTDGLTEIANRRAFDIALEEAWKRCLRKKSTIGIILFDIDFFKLYNDSLGHQAGDSCLRKVGHLLKEGSFAKRPGDIVARYGGEEFVVLLEDTSTEDSKMIAESIRNAIQELAINHPATKVPYINVVTVSIGVAAVVPTENTTALEILQMADENLYSAKAEGRNQVVASN